MNNHCHTSGCFPAITTSSSVFIPIVSVLYSSNPPYDEISKDHISIVQVSNFII
ncbi:hypothetical protein Hanom_Chr00s000005g01612781 [Helianthus anomalus]